MKRRIRKPEPAPVLIEGHKLNKKTGKMKSVRYWVTGK